MDIVSRTDLGAYYTPAEVADHMVGLLKGLGPDSSVLEPSSGDGVFVDALLRTGLVDASQVEAWDINPACEAPVTSLGARFVLKDTLLPPAGHTPEPRFTHAIGNPPYLNKQSAYIKKNRAALAARFPEVGANDTYAMFIVETLRHLAPGGQLVFLISDTFLTLGIHRRLRTLLLESTTICSVTLLGSDVFTDAAVSVAVLNLTNAPPPEGHRVAFVDASSGLHTASTRFVSQSRLAAHPGHVMVHTSEALEAIQVVDRTPKLLGLLDGGLGMHTGDNRRFLAVVSWPHSGPLLPAGPGVTVVEAGEVDGKAWRFYHKRGGRKRWFAYPEHAVRWDLSSRTHYGIPASALADDPSTFSRDGVAVSGVADRLTARALWPTALWESNKVFGFYPKDPARYPASFFLAVFNSAAYNRMVRALNHTVSLQVRDLKALPLLPFTRQEVMELARLGSLAVAHARTGEVPPAVEQRIDEVVESVFRRAV